MNLHMGKTLLSDIRTYARRIYAAAARTSAPRTLRSQEPVDVLESLTIVTTHLVAEARERSGRDRVFNSLEPLNDETLPIIVFALHVHTYLVAEASAEDEVDAQEALACFTRTLFLTFPTEIQGDLAQLGMQAFQSMIPSEAPGYREWSETLYRLLSAIVQVEAVEAGSPHGERLLDALGIHMNQFVKGATRASTGRG